MTGSTLGNFTVDFPGKLTDIGPMSGIEQLLIIARRYAELEDVPLSTVSSRVFNDGKKLRALEGGADITAGRLEKSLRWFSLNWPADEVWPDGAPRPDVGLSDFEEAQV